MPVVVFLRDAGELDLVRSATELPGDTLFYILFAKDWFALRKRGVSARVLAEHLEVDEIEPLYERAFADAARLERAAASGDRPNLGRCFKVHYWEFLSEAYALELALRRALAATPDAKVLYVRRHSRIPRSHIGLTDARTLLAPMLTRMARGRTVGIPAPPASWARTRAVAGRVEEAIRALARATRQATTFPPPLAAQGRRAIGFGNGYDALAVLPDVLHVARESALAPLLVTAGIDRETMRTGLVWRAEYESVPTMGLPAPRRLSAGGRRKARVSFRAMKRELEAIPEIGRYHLAVRVRALVDEYISVQGSAGSIDEFLRAHAGSELVITHFNGFEERLIEQLADKHGVRLHARPHGWMNSLEGFEFEAAVYYCNGPLNRAFVDRYYGYGERIRISPDRGIMAAASRWKGLSETERLEQRASLRERAAIAEKRVVLLMTTAARASRALNEFDPARWSSTWEALLDFAAGAPDVHLIVKSHKNNFDDAVVALARERGVSNLTVLAGRLEEALMMADLTVDLGKPGSATLTALMFGSPTLLYGGMYRYLRPFGDAVHGDGSALLVKSPEDLTEELRRILTGGEDELRKLTERGNALRQALVTLPDGGHARLEESMAVAS